MANTGDAVAPARTVTSPLLLSVFVPVLTMIGGVWAAAIWTSTQENKLARLEDRLTTLEKYDGASHSSRLSQVEYRLNWMDEEKNRDRNERKQIDRDIREALDKLNSIVIRLEINDPYRRRR
jgi:hypothetical protein